MPVFFATRGVCTRYSWPITNLLVKIPSSPISFSNKRWPLLYCCAWLPMCMCVSLSLSVRALAAGPQSRMSLAFLCVSLPLSLSRVLWRFPHKNAYLNRSGGLRVFPGQSIGMFST